MDKERTALIASKWTKNVKFRAIFMKVCGQNGDKQKTISLGTPSQFSFML